MAWTLLALVGFCASLFLVEAGPAVGYQHWRTGRALAEHSGALLVLLSQLVAVTVGGWGRAHAAWRWTRSRLPGWRSPMLALGMTATSAVVGRDLGRFGAELLISSLLQLLQLATVALAVSAVPEAHLHRWRQWLDGWLGTDDDTVPESAPPLDGFALVTALAATITCALLALVVYERHPHVQDEVVYLLQARMFAEGRLTVPAPPVPEAFSMFLMAIDRMGWYSPVPPGLGLVFAPAVWIGAVWLVNPLLTGLNLLLCAKLLPTVVGQRTTRLTLLLIAVSPWQLFLGMSFMAHATTLTCGLLAALSVAKSRATGALGWTWLGGLALGLAAAIRQLDAAIMAVSVGLWAVGLGGRRLRLPAVAGLVLGTVVGVLPLFWYNRLFTGRPGTFPIMTYSDSLFGKGTNDYGFGPNRGMGWALDPNPGHGPVDGMINTALNLAATQVELFGWGVGSLLFVGVLLLRHRWQQADRAMLAVVLLTWLAYFFNYFSGGPDFGARYWYVMLVPLAVLSARGILRLDADDGAKGRIPLAVAVLTSGTLLCFMPWRSVDKYWHYRGMRADMRALVSTKHLGQDLVLVRGQEVPDYASAAAYTALDADDPVPIYARRRNGSVDSAVVRAYPRRRVWLVDGPSITGDGYIVRAGPLSMAEALRALGATR